ncbi:serine/threonine protein kinase [Luteolibacter soli]|uniref:Serine/threonine-protein kinase n=1 Tax=Luteolibacter soli TaxID=3135280 RepID=A0ABU9AZQ9_9BACT
MIPSINEMLFTAAASFRESAVRRAFLKFACQGDAARLRQLEEMLEIQQDAEDFFDLEPAEVETVDSPAEEESGLGACIGPYHLIDRLGAGGCGVVYLAEQREPVKRKVALKIVRLGMDTENVVARFNLEREALALMDHPNIARVLDGGATPSGRPYFVMELVDGERITAFCDRKHLGIRARLDLFTLVCEAIQHAHQKGVIHRDIKPSNVLVRELEGRAEPKVIDFGIAKAAAGSLDAEGTMTLSGQLIGTPAYMSPEQAEGGVDIDTRTDIYSLGALLRELLTGRPPLTHDHFKDRGLEEIRAIVREGDTVAPSVRLRDIPADEMETIARERGVDPQRLPSLLAGDLDWIVMKAVENERHRRYETANGLAMDVRRYLNEEPVLARPPSRRYLFTKLVRRNRVTFAAAGIALFGLLGGLALSTWLFFRERDARNEQARLLLVAEAGDLVSQAAVRLKYNDEKEADKLLEGLPVDRVPRSLEAATTFMRVANWNLTKGNLQTAAKRFNALGHVLTSVDMTDSEHISFDLLSVLTAVCEWGEPGQFEELRMLAIKRFANSANPIVAEQVVKATLMKPADPTTLERLKPLIKVLEDSLDEPLTGKGPHMVAWRQFSLAMIAYRQGRLDDAAEWAQRSLDIGAKSENDSAHRKVSNQLVLAMVDMQQGRAAAIPSALKDLRKEVDQWTKPPLQLYNADGTLWYNQWAVLMLLREAEKMATEKGG